MRAHSLLVVLIVAAGCAGGPVQETSGWFTTEYSGFSARSQTTSEGIVSELSSKPDGILVATLLVTKDRAVWTSSTDETRTVDAGPSASLPGDNAAANDWLYLTTQTAAKRLPAALELPPLHLEDGGGDGGCVNSGDCSSCCGNGRCCSCCGRCTVITCSG